MTESVHDRVQAAVADNGSLPFRDLVELALYDPELGFYATTGRAGGSRGDFVTSVEAGPLFGAIIADWLDGIWRSAGEPADFHVAEVGAGVGTLFRAINRAAPACFDALRYTLVERSAAMRETHATLPGDGWVSSSDLPEQRQHAVVANELLDNLAFDIAERVSDGWALVHVAKGNDEQLTLKAGPADAELAYLDELVPGVAPGTRVPVAVEAASWVRHAQRHSDHVLAFDYAASTAELAERGQAGWLRTYAAHGRGNDPLTELGGRDITYDVPVDQLPPADSVLPQAEWLQLNGLPERLATARSEWAERGHIGDLAAMFARSAINEAEALTDRAGLGGFLVLEWSKRERDGD